jgi:diguanylate cyclase
MFLSYNYYLIALSLIVAVQAGYVGLSLAKQIPASFAANRRLMIAGSAITLSVGIWSMHFIGMLALITVTPIDYLVLPTLLSFLVCVLVTGIAIYMASLRSRYWLVLGALFMGLGIATMHYVGMIALHSSAHMTHDNFYVVASIMIAIAASGLALWFAFLAEARFPIVVSAIVFGLAVSGMHYTAMAGTTMHFMASDVSSASLISSDILAMIVSVVAFAISGVFMLAMIPKESLPSHKDIKWDALTAGGDKSTVTQGIATLTALEQPVVTHTEDHISVLLPIEKNGNRFHISSVDIVSVHANAHYTFIFNGRDDLFCPLSISEVDERLGTAEFFRTHRSYIVKLQHVSRIRKAGDAALAELDTAIRRTVPVSRNRITQLRTELANFNAKIFTNRV